MGTKGKKHTDPVYSLNEVELERVLMWPEVEERTSLSKDSVKRHHPEKIVKLSPRRQGVTMRNVLRIARGQ